MSDTVGSHNDLHSEQGARSGEHPGRSRNPVIKVADIAWLEFEKPDLARAEEFARAFGFATVFAHCRRGSVAGHRPRRAVRDPSPRSAVALRRHRVQGAGRHRRAPARRCHGRERKRPLPESLGGISVDLTDPSGFPVRVVAGTASPARAARPDRARLQLRPSTSAHQRHAAPEPRARPGTATWPRRRPDHQVHRGARTGTSTTSA